MRYTPSTSPCAHQILCYLGILGGPEMNDYLRGWRVNWRASNVYSSCPGTTNPTSTAWSVQRPLAVQRDRCTDTTFFCSSTRRRIVKPCSKHWPPDAHRSAKLVMEPLANSFSSIESATTSLTLILRSWAARCGLRSTLRISTSSHGH